MATYSEQYSPFAYETITVADTAVGLTSATYKPSEKFFAVKAILTLETAQIRFRIDGTAPTSTEGHLLEVGEILTLESYDEISKFKAIRTGGTSGTLRVTYLR